MFKNNYLIILIFIFTAQCGYQVVNQKDLKKFYIKSIELEGEKRLNHKISKNILFYSKESNSNVFNVKIKTNKSKSIIEKNIKNEIVKYQINISSNVEFYNFETGVLFTNTFSERGNFTVGNKNIDTRNSEKKLIEDLTGKISKKIIKKLRLDKNDS
tara:strand:+ start:301 stop:771 length:471 start_codon:yes stop_codon:yes gene_type:complete